MNHYWICGIGIFIGTFLGFFIAALLGMAHKGDHGQELWKAYQDGFEAGITANSPPEPQSPHRSV